MTALTPQPQLRRPDRKITVYMSEAAWAALVRLMGPDGKPSPTINALILEADRQQGNLTPAADTGRTAQSAPPPTR